MKAFHVRIDHGTTFHTVIVRAVNFEQAVRQAFEILKLSDAEGVTVELADPRIAFGDSNALIPTSVESRRMSEQTRAALESWLQKEENRLSSTLCLHDLDREFFRQVGIAVEDAAWPLGSDSDQEPGCCVLEILNPSVDREAE